MDHERKDDDLEKLLHSMPKIKDTRTEEEILERLKKDDRLSKTPVTPLRKKRRIVPLVAAVAAVLLVAILIPSFMNSMDAGKQSADESSTQEDSEGVPATARDHKQIENFSDNATSESSNFMSALSQYAVYPSELNGGRILHLGLQDAQAVSIPVSFLLTKEQLEAKGLTGTSTELELYEAFAGELDEQALGFEPRSPLNATFNEKGDQLNVLLNDTHEYDLSSATQEMFLQSLMQTFPSYREIHLLDESGNPAEFDQVGQLEPIRSQGVQAHTPYYVFIQENGQELLSPNFMQQAKSYEEALHLMQIAPNDLFTPSIPKELGFTVTVKDGVAEVAFDEVVQLESMEMNEASRLVDVLALTAASFDVKLKLTNVEPMDWNSLNFSEPLPRALGANPLPFVIK
ncbi:hypothetical protein DVB69_03430 [Sporosarcina sp. BI001-red]|uniref:hypothetical protein n=1 Tax=Sporosarcina sp. BI001-red TaxID=2282866 RepID=UPI000E2201AD|nr:hypothetical protein [Sporosarcina sp. BI001-red]REB09874.1 hypothetical protein DVB69_03430 [Sporosarcina sp. BI001-red]